MPEKILKVPEKKYELKNTREKLKKSAREATREKIGKNPFLGHFFFLGEEKKHWEGVTDMFSDFLGVFLEIRFKWNYFAVFWKI